VDIAEAYNQLRALRLAVVCEHEDITTQESSLENIEWQCEEGFQHEASCTLLADGAYWACHDALQDYAATEHPSSLVHFRTTNNRLSIKKLKEPSLHGRPGARSIPHRINLWSHHGRFYDHRCAAPSGAAQRILIEAA
jgi:hypothetical protein